MSNIGKLSNNYSKFIFLKLWWMGVKLVDVCMDDGTTGIAFAIMNGTEVLDVFKISREDSKAGRVSAIEELSKRTDLDDIELMIITYAMGDGIN